MKRRSLFLSLLIATLPLVVSQGGPPDELAPFGFSEMRVLKIESGAFGLTAADFDEDGIRDLAFVNNAKARIDLLLSRPGGVKAEEEDRKPNELPVDPYTKKRELLTEKEVTSFLVADLSNDGHLDIAFYGKPKELQVAYGDGTGSFERTVTFPIDDGNEAPYALAAGDLDGDGLTDLALLLEKQNAFLYQQEEGTLGEPLRVPRSVEAVGGISVADVDGDGRVDFLQFASQHATPVIVRLQEEGGVLGPEIGLSLPPYRTVDVADLHVGGGSEFLVVQRSSGLFRLLTMVRRSADATNRRLGSPRFFPFGEERSGKERRLALADVDGDGKTDVLVTEPGTARIAFYRQGDGGRLQSRLLFPSLSETEHVVAADFDGDGRAEVAVLSGKEKAVGISSLDDDGRLAFPTSLPFEGTPRALGAGELTGDASSDLVIVGKGEEGWKAVVFPGGEGFGEGPIEHALAGLDPKRDDAHDVLVMDIDKDGSNDLLLYDKYRMIRAFLANAEGGYTNAAEGENYAGSLVEKKERGATAVADLTGDGRPELLVASENFARGLSLEAGRLTVKDQVNARAAGSRIRALEAADLDGDGTTEVLLLDGSGNVLTLLARGESGIYEPMANLPVGDFQADRIHVGDVDGDGRPDVVLMGRDRFGVLSSEGGQYELEELAGFESATRDGYLYALSTGDLNGQGGPDLAIADVRNAMIELKSYDEEEGFAHRLKWRVFEEKLHESGRSSAEPRELVVADLTGDGLEDLAVLVHDRLLVYEQDRVGDSEE